MLRLRVTVQRNALPALNIIWSVPATASAQAYTVARLLEDINKVAPLETEDWGLEDYAVEVGGFECLHFAPVLQSLKDDDHVTIRPLLTAEVRARTLSGRLQISEGGQHLVDGVPFGRPYLRMPNRPPVGIPPRKKQRLLQDTPLTSTALTTAAAEQTPSAKQTPPAKTSEARTSSGKSDKVVRFQQPLTEEFGSSDEDDDDFEMDDAEMDIDSEISSDDTSSDSESDVTDSSANPDDDDINLDNPLDESSSDSDSASESSSDSGSDSSESDSSDSSDGKDGNNSEEPVERTMMSAPGRGSKTTKYRNQRRRDSNTLKRLIAEGKLPVNSTHADLRMYQARQSVAKTAKAKDTPPKTVAWGQRKSARSNGNANEPTEDRSNGEEANELEERRQRLLAQLNLDANVFDIGSIHQASNSGEVDHSMEDASAVADPEIVQDTMQTTSDKDTLDHANGMNETPLYSLDGSTDIYNADESNTHAATPVAVENGASSAETGTANNVVSNGAPSPSSALGSTPTRRSLIVNKEAFRRIVKQQATNRPINRPGTGVRGRAATNSQPEDAPAVKPAPGLWKSKIKLSAFECWDEDVELGTPPFPFKQDWDESVKALREKSKNKKNKNKKRRVAYDEPTAFDDSTIQDYEENGQNVPESADNDTAAIEAQISNDVDTATSPTVDFPNLPADLESLPELQSSDVKKGAFIVFKYLKVDFSLNGPEMSDFVTAQVVDEGDSGGAVGMIPLRLAPRDVEKSKVVEQKGSKKRKFGLFDTGSEEMENGLIALDFVQLMEAKLLQGATA